MKNILIVSLGTRDIQVDSSITESSIWDTLKNGCQIKSNPKDDSLFWLTSPRSAGSILSANFDSIGSFLKYPIIKPAIDCVLLEKNKIDKIVFVCTDQSRESEVDDFFKNNDTIELSNLLEKKIKRDYKTSEISQIKKLILTKDIIFIDSMYEDLEQSFNNILKFDKEDNIYLMLQGGIDAINTALLLRCIERYPLTKQLNKPENAEYAFELQFPKKFRANFDKHKLIHAVENYNYASLIALNYNENTNLISEYALARLSFNFDEAKKVLRKLSSIDERNRGFYQKHFSQLSFPNNFKDRQREVYLSAKIAFKNKSYADFLSKMFTMSETILKPEVSKILNGEIIFNASKRHAEWNKLLENNSDILEHLTKCSYNGTPLHYQSPNRHAFKEVYFFNLEKEEATIDPNLDLLLKDLDKLNDLRNQGVHSLSSVSIEDINQALKLNSRNIEDLISTCDQFFSIEGFSTYDEINQKILQLI